MENSPTLTVDAGGTKTAWKLADTVVQTAGINPSVMCDNDIEDTVRAAAAQMPDADEVRRVRFYGAGCTGGETNARVEAVLRRHFAEAEITVASDLRGVAEIMLGGEPGVAVILGTGSNSCLWDGCKMVLNTRPMGYILGDEGSGADIGKRLLTLWQRGCLPKETAEKLSVFCPLSYDAIISKVYREPGANRFLASLVPFCAQNIGEECIQSVVASAFADFVRTQLAPYTTCFHNSAHFHGGACRGEQENSASADDRTLPVAAVGGVAWAFADMLAEQLRARGFRLMKAQKGIL